MTRRKFLIYKLKFTSPLHISRGKEDDDYSKSERFIHSDTLKSAIFSVAVLLNPSLQNEKEGEKFFDSFLVSSTYPYYSDILFLPKPKGLLPLTDEGASEPSYDFRKLLKKVNFIEFDLFFEIFKTKKVQFLVSREQIVSDFLMSKEVLEKIFPTGSKEHLQTKKSLRVLRTGVQDRVYIRKLNEIYDKDEKKLIYSDPFIVERIYFEENTGLYFILEEKENFNKEFFDKVLKNLGVFGLGTDRNVGNGQFTLDSISEKVLEFDDNADYLMNLSLFLPKKQEVESLTTNCQYKLIPRGGWISNVLDMFNLPKSQLKKSVYMIEEASIFERKELDFVGKKTNLSPDSYPHPVWREGRAIFIPVNNIKI